MMYNFETCCVLWRWLSEMAQTNTHIFIGAGPANLDRALRIKKQRPDARFFFFDKRVSFEGRLDRDNARANIFRFPVSEKQSIIDNGIPSAEFDKVSTERDFSEKEGFQSGDKIIFGDERFTQIQIRDLQQLYLTQLKGPNTSFILINIDLSDYPKEQVFIRQKILASITREMASTNDATKMAELMSAQLAIHRGFTCHIAVGALSESTTKNAIIYPPKSDTRYLDGISPDLAEMYVTPHHGTVTFQLKNIKAEALVSLTESLDDARWEDSLNAHGWSLLRPPRVRLFYANDIMYIGTEMPASFAVDVDESGRPTERYKNRAILFARQIAALMIPAKIRPILFSPANYEGVNGPTYFLTHRGETGNVLHDTYDSLVIYHGDSRYLPHYQTGSGFLTAIEQNKVYVNIYLKKTFSELYQWAKEAGYVSETESIIDVKKRYGYQEEDIKDIEPLYVRITKWRLRNWALQGFQADLYMLVTRKILDENKEKVGEYFKQIHVQALNLLSEDATFERLRRDFVKRSEVSLVYASAPSAVASFKKEVRPIVIMEMLIHGNNTFLKTVLPKLINIDLSTTDLSNDAEVKYLHQLRDSVTQDYVEHIDCKAIYATLSHDVRIQLLKDILEHGSTAPKLRRSIMSTFQVCPSKASDMGRFLGDLSTQAPIMVKLFEDYPRESNDFFKFISEHVLDDSSIQGQIRLTAKLLRTNVAQPLNEKVKERGFRFFKPSRNKRNKRLLKINTLFTKRMDSVSESGSKAELARAICELRTDLKKYKSFAHERQVVERGLLKVSSQFRSPLNTGANKRLNKEISSAVSWV